jgi:hypothetical protein
VALSHLWAVWWRFSHNAKPSTAKLKKETEAAHDLSPHDRAEQPTLVERYGPAAGFPNTQGKESRATGAVSLGSHHVIAGMRSPWRLAQTQQRLACSETEQCGRLPRAGGRVPLGDRRGGG